MVGADHTAAPDGPWSWVPLAFCLVGRGAERFEPLLYRLDPECGREGAFDGKKMGQDG